MYAAERHAEIADRLERAGRVSVVELAREFEVTTETIRRDLAAMERTGALRRVHGGAVSTDRESTVETPVAERVLVRGPEKRRIAARALDVLGDDFHGSVFVDAGTTTLAVARLLSTRFADTSSSTPLQAVTHAIPVAAALAARGDIAVTVIGGRVRGVTAAAVGPDTVRSIDLLRPDIAFIGANGVSAGFGVSTPDPEEAAVKRAIVRAARRVVVVADSTKLGEELLVRVAGLHDIDVLVTDDEVPADLGRALAEAGVEVWVA